jgi:Right handed beta helix region
MPRLSPVLGAVALAGTLVALPAPALQRAFVASDGSDANTATNCTLGAPCRGFAAALTVVDAGGEIVALDAAGYGPVTINKSVTITANPGFYAGIAAASGTAVTINTPGVIVTLRGLNINGIGATHGVVMTAGTRLSIENCVISNFTTNGVEVSGSIVVRIVEALIRDNGAVGARLADGVTATISRSTFMGNASQNIYVRGSVPGTTTRAAISETVASGAGTAVDVHSLNGTAVVRGSIMRSSLVNNTNGLLVDGAAATATAGENLISGNSVGFLHFSGTLRTLGNNLLDANTADSTGVITPASGG